MGQEVPLEKWDQLVNLGYPAYRASLEMVVYRGNLVKKVLLAQQDLWVIKVPKDKQACQVFQEREDIKGNLVYLV